MHEWPLGMFPLTWPVCTKTNLFVEYSVNGKTMKHRGRGSTFFVTHFSAEAYLPFGSDVFQLPTCNHVVKKTLKLSLAFFSRELMTWGPLVDNEQWERCFWFDSDFLLEFCGKITLFEKSNFCPKIQFWQNHQNSNIFTSFSPKFFLTIFVVKLKLSTAKKAQNRNILTSFSPKNRQFSRKIKVEFLDKKRRFLFEFQS